LAERGVRPEVLLIEDDPQIRRFLRASLLAEDYRLHEAVTGEEGIAQAAARQPDVIVLDLGLPGVDGFEVIRNVRQWSRVPILILSARGRERDKIEALDLGADDYVSKPFGIGELLARLRAALRRSALASSKNAEVVFRLGDLSVDLENRVVQIADREVHLTPIEYKLLQTLVRNAGKVLTQRQLLNEVWGPHHIEQPQYLRVYMAQLRGKLEADPARPRYLLTEPGVGYRLLAE
jgi:two-component system KDP operon response regulator KdpE